MDEVLHESFEPADPVEVSPGAGEVHVWAVPLRGDPDLLGALLSEDELDRASRFHFVDHRRRYAISHGALRRILGGCLDQDPKALEFTAAPRGKPFLAETERQPPGTFFNLSHSSHLALIGVSRTELGIDCEKLRAIDSYYRIAEKHFSSDEFGRLGLVPEEDRLLAFYRCWTRKEAYVKALGEGLTLALDSFDVSLGDQPGLLRCRERVEDWSMLDVSPGPDFVGACALRGKDVVVKRWLFDVG